ncbi:MAG TPA: N-formylglutamate amidohydrolase [Methanolinea sp.]|jgi:formiminoglutamase|nr:MAG: N-formylglutamate amidohydrolase [Methanoregulaceae archaeon PtaB.Bin009]OPY39557.1 MAG: N-formylglutamate amidohydrolase [Methanoregulaceae archaeon PtaU1.Bin066]HII76029.1 N-formylglutamate amidohydrolase [Methanolinea sp.]HNQ29960.1 N-formylglutamate amidohydrolase [Methanolinea sp.]HNS83662.1 N-formylglutamate amidohydrolase [Methanolinea sp.]
MSPGLPILISIPHGGVGIPEEVAGAVALDPPALSYYSDPASERLFGFKAEVKAFASARVSRVIVDLNRPPYHLPPRRRDGVVKFQTSLGAPVWKEGMQPDIQAIHRLLLRHYFPYHAKLDSLLDSRKIAVAFDCHSMVPVGLPGQPDEGQPRPLICLGNNGDRNGHPRRGALCTCPPEWIRQLAERFRDEFPGAGSVTLNHPFSGGFISNAHYWHKGIPWIQVEVNRSLYEGGNSSPQQGALLDMQRMERLKEIIRGVLSMWYMEVVKEDSRTPPLFQE